jgi:hypothetical protein
MRREALRIPPLELVFIAERLQERRHRFWQETAFDLPIVSQGDGAGYSRLHSIHNSRVLFSLDGSSADFVPDGSVTSRFMSSQPIHFADTASSVADDIESGLREDPRWTLALRVAESPYFAKSPLLSQFLLFVCERTLEGRTDDLTEQNIGVVVFRRRPGYRTSEDNIVRTYVRHLRQRLDRYFEDHAADESLLIVIPRGGYCAVFEERQKESLEEVIPLGAGGGDTSVAPSKERPLLAISSPGPDISIPQAPRRRFRWVMTLGLIALFGTLIAFFLFRENLLQTSVAHPIWTQLFSENASTYVVTTDSGLGVLQDVSGKYATLNQYIDGSYFSQFEKVDSPESLKLQRLSRERLTSVPDVNTVAGILTLPEARQKRVILRNARTLRLDDLKQSNLILLGSIYGDPWISLFEPRMNFRFDYHATSDTYESVIVNKKPLSGEPAVYRNSSTAAPYSTYAVVAFLPNLNGTGWVLIVEGLTVAGTEAASEFLFHGSMGTFLKTVPRDKHGVRPFEVVLKTTNLDSESSPAEVVAKRIY